MSTRDYAIDVINTLSEEKLKAFLVLFADENTLAKMESEIIVNDPNRKRYNSFKEIVEEIENDYD